MKDRLLDPLRWGQLAARLIYDGVLRLVFNKYWEITNIYHHGGVEYVPRLGPLTGIIHCQAAPACIKSHMSIQHIEAHRVRLQGINGTSQACGLVTPGMTSRAQRGLVFLAFEGLHCRHVASIGKQDISVRTDHRMAHDCRYHVNSIPLETDKTLPTLSGLPEIFQHHSMQVVVYLCDPSGRGPLTPCDLKGPKDGPQCKAAASKLNGAASSH